jgi:hypothetical protein
MFIICPARNPSVSTANSGFCEDATRLVGCLYYTAATEHTSSVDNPSGPEHWSINCFFCPLVQLSN